MQESKMPKTEHAGLVPPKTDEELVYLAQLGDSDAADEVLSRYKNVVKTRAAKYYMLGADQDDVVQEGMIGLFKAVRTYNPAGGASFKTYTGICIHNQIVSAIESSHAKRHAPLNDSVSLDVPVGESDSTLAQVLPAGPDANPAERAIFKETISLMLSEDSKVLSAFEKQVVTRLKDGRGYKEIAEELGKPPKSIDNAIQRIRRKLSGFFVD